MAVTSRGEVASVCVRKLGVSACVSARGNTVALCCRCQGLGSARLPGPTLTLFFPLVHSFSLDSDEHPSIEKCLFLVYLGILRS